MLKVGRSISWSEVQAMPPAHRKKEAYGDGFNVIRRFAELLREIFRACSAQLLEKLDEIL